MNKFRSCSLIVILVSTLFGCRYINGQTPYETLDRNWELVHLVVTYNYGKNFSYDKDTIVIQQAEVINELKELTQDSEIYVESRKKPNVATLEISFYDQDYEVWVYGSLSTDRSFQFYCKVKSSIGYGPEFTSIDFGAGLHELLVEYSILD